MSTPRACIAVVATAVIAIFGTAACSDAKSCTALGIIREMPYEATLPADMDASTTVLELCIGAACDRARFVTSQSDGIVRCSDEDGRTEKFPTQCTFTPSNRKLALRTNTVYGGHAGSDPLSLDAFSADGTRTELLRGTVTYEDTTDDAARGACTEAWHGTLAVKNVP